jgi:hypothetical protein
MVSFKYLRMQFFCVLLILLICFLQSIVLQKHITVRFTCQGCKLLSDIGQCPTKFGKCPSKSNFDRTLVRMSDHKKNSHITHFFAVTKSDLHFAIKFTRHSSILLNVAPEWLYNILVSWLIYILWRIYIYVRPNLVVLVFVRPNSGYVRPKLKVIGQMSCQVKYLFAALTCVYTRLYFTFDLSKPIHLTFVRGESFVCYVTRAQN